MESLIIAHAGASPLRLRVGGEVVLLFGEHTKTSGSYQVCVDGGESKTYSANCAEGNMRLVQMIAEGLDSRREHAITITPLLNQGEELRIESICVAGGQATVVLRTSKASLPGN